MLTVRCPALVIGIVLILSLKASVAIAEDYYETLGITKNATVKDIRKGFKKLALTMHPDKNPNDPDAHSKFVRITEIYEVLKDPDTREKYDKYGEEGLKDDKRGGRYESYNYYRDEFGIYDDDPEVVTLDGGDFDASIKSGEVWFVNFYSPRCSHCHQLAPTWRKFAEELNGVINVGAVNCQDNRWICNNNGIRSYPSLVIFLKDKRPIRYQGDRKKKDLIRFVMEHVNVEVVDLWDGNVEQEVEERQGLPWVVSFCGGDTESEQDEDGEIVGDCPSRITRRKLSGLMNGLANVGSVDCGTSPNLCKRAKVTEKSGIYFFPDGTFPDPRDEDAIHYFESFDAREVHAEFMAKLMPGLPSFTKTELEKHVKSKPALIFLQFGGEDIDEKETSFKKLPAMLSNRNIAVAKVSCQDQTWCTEVFHMKEDATLAFKGKGVDDFEVFHGRPNTAELSMFAQDSSRARVSTLDPSHFDGRRMASDEKWFVDFFAPWCPPCRALLPELRTASQNLRDINFGTIDCTKFQHICTGFGIRSYPTTMLFNQSTVTEYTGHHHWNGILQFVQDLIDPPYDHFTPETFASLVQRREPGVTWIVDFYANWCGPCRALLPEWKRMAKMLKGVVKVGAIDCAKPDHVTFCKRHAVSAYPEIRLFPAKKDEDSNPLFEVFSGWNRNAHSLAGWAIQLVPNDVVDMQMSDFQDGLPKDPGPWLLDFFAPWCGHCHAFAPKFVLTSLRFQGRVKFGKVNCQMLPSICSKAGVRAYPAVYFYPPVNNKGKRASKMQITSQDPDAITNTVENYMKAYETTEKKEKKKKKDEL